MSDLGKETPRRRGELATHPDWSADDALLLLRTLARAVVRMHEVMRPGAFRLPYPHDAQRALDQIALICLERHATPPTSVPGLMLWCANRALSDWPVDLPPGAVGQDDHFIDFSSQEPTELCYEWAAEEADAPGASIDGIVIRRAIQICRAYDAPESYVALRRLLIESPVLTREGVSRLSSVIELGPVLDLVKHIYQPVPLGYAVDGSFSVCGRCRTLLILTRQRTWWCERTRCAQLGPPPVGATYPADRDDGLLQIPRPLRQFVTSPGLAELALEKAVVKAQVTVEMWPSYASYDLRVHLPGGQVWAVDVKDRQHPALLGRRATLLSPRPPYDQAFLVVPSYRFTRHGSYRKIFNAHCPREIRDGITLLSDRQFLRRLRAAVEAGKDTKNA